MKIEKVNDHQIRCTLTREDLANRELKISELAYGTEKAKSLFRDMMQQASFECGFEAEDIPLMIEAIPLNSECIVLIITKVEDPEELDTRFSKFAPSVHDDEEDVEDIINELTDSADDVLDLFKKLHENRTQDSSSEPVEKPTAETASAAPEGYVRIFSFPALNQLTRVAGLLKEIYGGDNTLYKDDKTGEYLLVVHQSDLSAEEYAKVCNLLSEYGDARHNLPFGASYLEEHYSSIIAGNALQALAQIL